MTIESSAPIEAPSFFRIHWLIISYLLPNPVLIFPSVFRFFFFRFFSFRSQPLHIGHHPLGHAVIAMATTGTARLQKTKTVTRSPKKGTAKKKKVLFNLPNDDEETSHGFRRWRSSHPTNALERIASTGDSDSGKKINGIVDIRWRSYLVDELRR